MGKKLSAWEAELYRRVDEVLHYIWDPIGSAGEPYARDEYDNYLPQIFRLVKEGATVDQIATHLSGLYTLFGLRPQPDHDRWTAETLVKYQSWAAERKQEEGG